MSKSSDPLDALRRPSRLGQAVLEIEHVEGTCAELAVVAERAGFRELARMLDLAVAEAHIVGQRLRAESLSDGSVSAQP